MDFESFISRQANHFLKELLHEGLTKKKARKNFPESIKNQVLSLQNYRCNYCNRNLDVINFDHIDGNRSNNLYSNCQALCPNCHAKKSRTNN